MTHRADYIWLDINGTPRQKSMFSQRAFSRPLASWTFDGSSCGLSTTAKSDLLLKPVREFHVTPAPPFATHSLVLCEVYNGDGTPHPANTRRVCMETMARAASQEPLFGIEQEYVIIQRNPSDGSVAPLDWISAETGPFGTNTQGEFYCGVGGCAALTGRAIAEEHVRLCCDAGIAICGINAEVMASQWEYQIGVLPGDEIGDHLIVSRYLLKLAAERHGADVSFHPKPARGWNGSGGHTNFSTAEMRKSYEAIVSACERLGSRHSEHMAKYGRDNDQRLCGSYETSDPLRYTYGVGDRSCSVRIPQHCYTAGRGYLEDRRPAANLDPYVVCGAIVETVCLGELNGKPE